MSTYELTQFQYDTLVVAANGGQKVFALLFDAPMDSQEKGQMFRQQMREIGELIGLELVEDVSYRFKSDIEMSKINNNREYGVYAITPIGVQMFEGIEQRVVN
jgi:hypothetical protein